jgi:hypothetical protein
MPRPRVKANRLEAEATAFGQTMGVLKAEEHFRNLAKGDKRHIQTHIGKFIDSLASKIDPLEAVAVAGTTYLVHQAIMGAPKFLEELKTSPLVKGAAYALNPTFFAVTTIFDILGQATGTQPTKEQVQDILKDNELAIWILSFVAAYLVIRYGASFVKDMGGFTGIAGMLAGI